MGDWRRLTAVFLLRWGSVITVEELALDFDFTKSFIPEVSIHVEGEIHSLAVARFVFVALE
jgi:hypothetical protein